MVYLSKRDTILSQPRRETRKLLQYLCERGCKLSFHRTICQFSTHDDDDDEYECEPCIGTGIHLIDDTIQVESDRCDEQHIDDVCDEIDGSDGEGDGTCVEEGEGVHLEDDEEGGDERDGVVDDGGVEPREGEMYERSVAMQCVMRCHAVLCIQLVACTPHP